MANKRTTGLQRKVAETILEATRVVVLGGRHYEIAPPTIGTLIMASEMLTGLPEEIKIREGREFQDILARAKDYGQIADLAAVLILGAKKAKETVEVVKQKGGLFRKTKLEKITRREQLRRRIMDEVSPAELRDAIVPLFEGLELNDFFVTTTFLTGINANVTKPTKVEKTTASGRS